MPEYQFNTVCPNCKKPQVAGTRKPLDINSKHKCTYESCGHTYKIKENLKI